MSAKHMSCQERIRTDETVIGPFINVPNQHHVTTTSAIKQLVLMI